MEGGLRCVWGMGGGRGWFAVRLGDGRWKRVVCGAYGGWEVGEGGLRCVWGMGGGRGWFAVRLADGTWKRVVYGASEGWDVEEGV